MTYDSIFGRLSLNNIPIQEEENKGYVIDIIVILIKKIFHLLISFFQNKVSPSIERFYFIDTNWDFRGNKIY
jgi:hypothetical protein